jgi:1,4-dihydroxy-2-naphthoyl-CoA synthase
LPRHYKIRILCPSILLYYLTEEAQEGKNAFLEKRDPNFKKYPKFP